jgi:hypothetical protein
MFSLILIVFAFVLAVVAGIMGPAYTSPNSPWPWRLLCWGIACYFLADILRVGPTLMH